MRKILLISSFFVFCIFTFSQKTSDKALSESVNKLNSAKTAADFNAAKNSFKSQISTSNWRPSYYAALSVLQQAEIDLRANKLENLMILAEDAENFLKPIIQSQSNNSEVRLLLAYVHIMKMSSGKNADFDAERQNAMEILYLKNNIDAENPRFDLLRAQLEYLLLKEKKSGKNLKYLFENAARKLNLFYPKTKLDPNWGFKDAQYYLTKIY